MNCIFFYILQECPLGTFKNVTGSDETLCYQCPSNELPHRAVYTSVRGMPNISDLHTSSICILEYLVNHVYEDAYNRFVDEINVLAAYQWWEGAIYSILCILTYPLAWSWQQWRRRKKLQRLREFVRSEYDHACLRSCRSRALYEGLKVCIV
ncbi:hypothetical protein B296_00028862 [Ensete ventricosum]|uniref:DUF8003 domain-containing protein n=1 Tax=Ensete ventricosum TaxID=4639 RepID=A0A427AMD2_ENSVE|nr:hypothetical protein B296_00028862 [Ensete ventricosum]